MEKINKKGLKKPTKDKKEYKILKNDEFDDDMIQFFEDLEISEEAKQEFQNKLLEAKFNSLQVCQYDKKSGYEELRRILPPGWLVSLKHFLDEHKREEKNTS